MTRTYDIPEERFTWYGWEAGEDVSPPEPGKEWLTIADGGEEYAVIVHRPSDHPDSEKWREQKEKTAQFIVDALNAHAANLVDEGTAS